MSGPSAAETAWGTTANIRARACPVCWLCGAGGRPFLAGLRDRLFGAPGTWALRRCMNARCQLVWMDPQPIGEDLHLAYDAYHTHVSAAGPASRIREIVRSGYLQGALGYTTGVGKRWHRYVRVLAHAYPSGAGSIQSDVMFLRAPRQRAARLLDVGCGNGDLLVYMRSLGWGVTGVDADPAAVRTALARGVDVSHGDLPSQRYPPASFDAVTIRHVIEHVHDPVALLAEAARVLKPDGRVVLLTPNSQSLGARLYGQDWRGWEPPRHLQVFNVDNLRATLERAGLAPIHVTSIARGAGDILSASARLRRERRSAADGAAEAAGSTDARRFRRIAMQFAERLATVVSRRAGEEVLAVAGLSAQP